MEKIPIHSHIYSKVTKYGRSGSKIQAKSFPDKFHHPLCPANAINQIFHRGTILSPWQSYVDEELRSKFPRKTIIKPGQICRFGSSFCVFRRFAHRSSSKLIGHHGLIRTRCGSTDSYQLTFIDDGKAYSARIVQIYINWARSLLLCQRGGVLHPSISWPCFSLV